MNKDTGELVRHVTLSIDDETLRKFRLLAPPQQRSALFRSMVNAEFDRRGLDALCNAVDPQPEQAR
jgi:hypothetical protein